MNDLTTRGAVSVALDITTLPQLREFCAILSKTEMIPKAYKEKPDDILVAMLHGQEVGLPHLQALQSIAVVNGIPSIYGDAALAMVRASGKLEDFDEWIEVDGARQVGPFPILKWAEEGKDIVAHCLSKRVGMSRPRVTTFSVDDAQRAKLWLKKGHNGFETPWCTVPQRMLMWRARGWNLRDNFGDVLKGLAIYEEAMDIDVSPDRDGVYRAEIENGKAKVEEVRERMRDMQNEPKEKVEQASPPPPNEPPKETKAQPTSSSSMDWSDASWKKFVTYMGDDPERFEILKWVRDKLKVKSAAALTGSAREDFAQAVITEAHVRKVKLVLGF